MKNFEKMMNNVRDYLTNYSYIFEAAIKGDRDVINEYIKRNNSSNLFGNTYVSDKTMPLLKNKDIAYYLITNKHYDLIKEIIDKHYHIRFLFIKRALMIFDDVEFVKKFIIDDDRKALISFAYQRDLLNVLEYVLQDESDFIYLIEIMFPNVDKHGLNITQFNINKYYCLFNNLVRLNDSGCICLLKYYFYKESKELMLKLMRQGKLNPSIYLIEAFMRSYEHDIKELIPLNSSLPLTKVMQKVPTLDIRQISKNSLILISSLENFDDFIQINKNHLLRVCNDEAQDYLLTLI